MQNEIQPMDAKADWIKHCKICKLWNLRKLKIPVCVEETFDDHLLSVIIMLSVILDGSHYQKSQKWLPWLSNLKTQNNINSKFSILNGGAMVTFGHGCHSKWLTMWYLISKTWILSFFMFSNFPASLVQCDFGWLESHFTWVESHYVWNYISPITWKKFPQNSMKNCLYTNKVTYV